MRLAVISDIHDNLWNRIAFHGPARPSGADSSCGSFRRAQASEQLSLRLPHLARRFAITFRPSLLASALIGYPGFS